ncbi:DNA repair protein rhp51 [Golovinomyces cichoracearum]|uniref:DNA repair protein rhp51 n=1 Tax=Golovinomyces cichoracearum TaxID=62708 RepID=A0A420IZV1_9PEZI|nr:DNA repair protein rhp51 [Golovinomyces cichoracearum]
MADDVQESQSVAEDIGESGPGAPTPLSALEGVAGLTKRDIQLIVDGGFNTVESVAYTPRRILEQIKGISEQKATKILTEGKKSSKPGLQLYGPISLTATSIEAGAYGLYNGNRNASKTKRANFNYDGLKTTRHVVGWRD